MVGDLNEILCISKRGPVFVPMLIAGTTGKKHIITRPQPAVCIGGSCEGGATLNVKPFDALVHGMTKLHQKNFSKFWIF